MPTDFAVGSAAFAAWNAMVTKDLKNGSARC